MIKGLPSEGQGVKLRGHSVNKNYRFGILGALNLLSSNFGVILQEGKKKAFWSSLD